VQIHVIKTTVGFAQCLNNLKILMLPACICLNFMKAGAADHIRNYNIIEKLLLSIIF
jgi:hypothetical protein